MLTYTKTTVSQEPRLEIYYDQMADNPRNWANIGLFFTKERDYHSPDKDDHPLYSIMINTADEADNTLEHIELMKKEAKEQGINIKYIYPITRYEHSGVVYRIGTQSGYDYSNCGFYIITDESLKEYGEVKGDPSNVVAQELETYTKWANGEVYGFNLYDEDGELQDGYGDIYDIDDIVSGLPTEFDGEDITQYIID